MRVTTVDSPSAPRGLKGLIIAPFSIVPVDEGGKAQIAAQIRQLRELGHELWYLAAGFNFTPEDGRAMAAVWGDRFVDASSGNTPRFHYLQKGLLRRAARLLRVPPPVDAWFCSHWLAPARALMSRVNFDYVLVHYVFFTRFLKVAPPGVRKIVDTQDLFTNRTRRLATQKLTTCHWWQCTRRGEIQGLRRSEYVMANQADEARVFMDYLKGSRRVVTVGHACAWAPLPEGPERVVGLLASDNPVNRAGLDWFIQNCWPRILAALPDARLLLAGRMGQAPGPWQTAPHTSSLGYVADVDTFYRQTMMAINPVAPGTGLKIKTMESLARGRALVSTTEGVAGIPRDFGAFVVADEFPDFAAEVIGLLRSEVARQRLVSGAGQLIEAWNRRQQTALASLFDGL